MASIKQNKKTLTWTAAIDRKGFPRKKKTFPTEALAQGWASREEGAIFAKGAGQYVPPEGSVGDLVRTYVKEYSTVNGGWSRSKQYNLDKIIEDIGHIMLKDFTRDIVIAYGRQIGKKPDGTGRGPVGTAERLNYLSKIFKQARDVDLKEMPCEAFSSGMAKLRSLGLVGDTDPRDRIIEEWEIAAIKKHLGVVMHDIIDTLMILPFRVGELCDIKWMREDAKTGKRSSDFDEINRRVRLFRKDTSSKKKTFKKMVWVSLPPIEVVKSDGTIVTVDLFDLLYKRERVGEGPFPINGEEATRQFSLAHKLAGIDDIHLHDTRAEAISALLAQGYDPVVIRKLSGHKNAQVFEDHYCRLSPRKLHALFKRQARINQQARAA